MNSEVVYIHSFLLENEQIFVLYPLEGMSDALTRGIETVLKSGSFDLHFGANLF